MSSTDVYGIVIGALLILGGGSVFSSRYRHRFRSNAMRLLGAVFLLLGFVIIVSTTVGVLSL